MKFARFFQTVDSTGPLVLRLGLAVAMFPHGAQKMLGLFGGHGFKGTMDFFTGGMHVPAFLAFLAICVEFFAPVALLLGFFTRLAGFALAVHIAVAAALGGHMANGFFMNWAGNQKGEGFEYHILVFALGLGLAFLGGGRWAIDSWIARNLGGGAKR